MKPTRFLIAVICLVLCGETFAQAQTNDSDTELSKVAENLAAQIKDQGKKKVAVIDFTDLQGAPSGELGKYVAEQLTIDLVMDRKGFSVLDRANLKQILDEHKLTATGLVDPNNAKKLGQFAGVDALILGTVFPSDQSVNLTVKIITTDTAEIVGVARAQFKNDAMMQQLESENAESHIANKAVETEQSHDATSTPSDEVAVIKTSDGNMTIAFWPDVAPVTVANFKRLARSGFYNGTCFHRVIKGFMIQGGDPLTKNPSKEAIWGTGGPGYTIKAEFNDHSHQYGVISMARGSDPNSAGSQFFICDGNDSFLDHQYTAFGHLIKGADVLDKIASTPTHSPDRPNTRIDIEGVSIVPADEIK